MIDFVLRSGHLKDGPDVIHDAGDLKLVEDEVVRQIGILKNIFDRYLGHFMGGRDNLKQWYPTIFSLSPHSPQFVK